MYAFLIVVHVIACLVLIAVILLQAGRGGGFSDALGSGAPQSILGTQTNVFMTRATEACAVIFIITSLSLGIITTQHGKSLMEKEMLVRDIKKGMTKKANMTPEELKKMLSEAAKTAPAASTVAATETKAAEPVKAVEEKAVVAAAQEKQPEVPPAASPTS